MRLHRAKFKSWLEEKPPIEIIGHNRDCISCPIANFYHEASKGCEIVIFDDGNGYTIDRGYDKRRLPAWASAFVFLVDGEAEPKITAGRAIEILQQIRP